MKSAISWDKLIVGNLYNVHYGHLGADLVYAKGILVSIDEKRAFIEDELFGKVMVLKSIRPRFHSHKG